jgi:23S rRNA pseudouridine2605 synthase
MSEVVAPARGDRIAKYLARAGVASRRDAERLLAEGKIRLNNVTVTHPATFVTPGDLVTVAGKLVEQPDRTRLWRYHKPEGLVTTHRDPDGRPTVFDKLRQQLPRVISVGRLDLTSEGLLLLTNDGALARTLELPTTGWIRRMARSTRRSWRRWPRASPSTACITRRSTPAWMRKRATMHG